MLRHGRIGSPEVADDIFAIYDDGDNTKKVNFEVSGVTTGTTRTITISDGDMNIVVEHHIPLISEGVVITF